MTEAARTAGPPPRRPQFVQPLPEGAIGYCSHCEQPVAVGEEVGPAMRSVISPHLPLAEHKTCRSRAQRDQAERLAREREQVELERIAAVGADARRRLPKGLLVSLGSPEFERRVKLKELRTVAARYALSCPVLTLLGPTGCGKSTTAAAIFDRLIGEAAAECTAAKRADNPPYFRMKSMRWVKSYELVRARKEHPLGAGEAPLVEQAIAASLLVLDDLGNEPRDSVIFEVLDQRYEVNAPTIVTSGLRQAEFRSPAHYGDAAWRRISQLGVVVEAWGA